MFHIDVLRGYQFSIQALKSQTCFEQKSTRDPKVLCSTRIKNTREIVQDQTCNERRKIATSHPKTLLTASRSKPFSSHSNEMR